MGRVVDIRPRISSHWRDEPARLFAIAEQVYERQRSLGNPLWIQLTHEQRQDWIDKIQREQY